MLQKKGSVAKPMIAKIDFPISFIDLPWTVNQDWSLFANINKSMKVEGRVVRTGDSKKVEVFRFYAPQ